MCNVIHFTVLNTVKCVALCISTSFCILSFHICFHKNNHVKMAFFIEEYLVVVCMKNYIQKFRRIVQSIFSHFQVYLFSYFWILMLIYSIIKLFYTQNQAFNGLRWSNDMSWSHINVHFNTEEKISLVAYDNSNLV